MSDTQLKELKTMIQSVQTDLETVKSNLKTLDKNLIATFNVANQTHFYVGADEGASSNSDMLQRILDAVTD